MEAFPKKGKLQLSRRFIELQLLMILPVCEE